LAYASFECHSEAKIAALKLTLAMAQERSGSYRPVESPKISRPVTPASAPAPTPSAVYSAPPEVLRGQRFYGLSKPDACVKLLKEIGSPLTPREMGDTLRAEGYPMAHEENPSKASVGLSKSGQRKLAM
jgi:hypothetical protein